MNKENGPFLRQMNENPDEKGELRFQFVEEDERLNHTLASEMFRLRVWDLVRDCINDSKDVISVRGVDLNDAESIQLIRDVIESWVKGKPELEVLRESIFQKITRSASERVLSKDALFSGVYGLNANKVNQKI